MQYSFDEHQLSHLPEDSCMTYLISISFVYLDNCKSI